MYPQKKLSTLKAIKLIDEKGLLNIIIFRQCLYVQK